MGEAVNLVNNFKVEKVIFNCGEFNELKQKIESSNGITLEDFNVLCKTIGFDSKTTELIRVEFESQGKIIDSYEARESHHI